MYGMLSMLWGQSGIIPGIRSEALNLGSVNLLVVHEYVFGGP